MRFGAFGALALAALAAACGTSFGESADDADDAGANRANAGDASTSDVSAPATTRDAGDASENQGDDADTISDAAAPVDGQTIIGISASLYFGCALRANGTTSCWGDNSSGELGIGSTSAPTTTPQLVHFPAKPLRVSGTTATGCALLEDGTVACWGSNQYGQLDLALDAATSSATPIRIASDAGVLQNAKEVVAGFALACARIATDASADTETVCWGTDVNGDTGQTGLPNGTVQTICP